LRNVRHAVEPDGHVEAFISYRLHPEFVRLM